MRRPGEPVAAAQQQAPRPECANCAPFGLFAALASTWQMHVVLVNLAIILAHL